MDGDYVIAIGFVLSAICVLIGTKLKDSKSKEERTAEMADLELTITEQQGELEAKQIENSKLTKEVLDFNHKINANTSSIKAISNEIKDVAANTNIISSIIKDEQRVRGKIEFPFEDYDIYELVLGGISLGVISPDKPVLDAEVNGIPTSIQVKEGNILVDILIRDSNNNIIFKMVESQWIVNKGFVLSVNHDSKGIEVLNYFGTVIFRMTLSKGILRVEGIFFHERGVTLVNSNYIGEFDFNEIGKERFLHSIKEYSSLVKPVFVHYGEDYLGKRLQK